MRVVQHHVVFVLACSSAWRNRGRRAVSPPQSRCCVFVLVITSFFWTSPTYRIAYKSKPRKDALALFKDDASIIVRVFEAAGGASVYSLVVTGSGGTVWRVSSEQTQLACCTDAQTGRPMPPEAGVTYK